jgi:PAS domain S-box-containing protein
MEAHYKAIINRMSDGFFSLDNDLRYTFANQKISQITGKELSSLIGHYIWDVFPEVIGSATYHAINKAFSEQTYICNTDYFEPFKLWQENHIYPSDEGLSVFVRDISDAKRAEIAFQKREKHLQSLIKSTEDIIALSNQKGELIFVSPALERLTGYSEDEVIGKNPGFLMHPDYALSSKKLFEQLLKNPGMPIPRTNRFITKSGDYVWVEGTVINLLHDESVQAIVSNYHDITQRKITEDSLKKSEELYRSLFQNLVHAFAFCKVTYDKKEVVDYTYLSINKKYEALLGVNNPVGKKASEYFPDYKNTMRLYFEIINRIINTKKVEIAEHYVERLDKWFSLTFYSPQKDYFVCLVEDITEKKKFNEQQILFASIINSSDDAIISTDLSGILTSWNYGAEKIYGYNAKEAIGLNVTKLIPEDRLQEDSDMFAKIIKGKRVEHYETKRLKKSKELIYISLTVSPIRDVEGNIVGISKIARDVSEQKKFSEQSALAASIINYTQDAVFSRDMNGYITSWNASAEKHFGYSAHEAIGMHIKKIIPAERLHEWDEVDRKVKTGMNINSLETQRKTKNGQLIYFALTISPIRNLEKKTVGYSIIARDISERKISEEKIRISENNLHTIIENSTEAFVLLDSKFLIKAFNSKALSSVLLQFGHREVATGKNFLDFIHEERKVGLQNLLNRVLSGESIQYESDFYKKEGKDFWFSANFIPVKEGNQITGICVAVKDITARKLAETKIKRSEENLRAIFNNSTQGFILLDPNGAIKLYNQNAIKFSFSAYGRHMKVGKIIYDYIDKSRVTFLKELVARVLKGEVVNYSRLYERAGHKTIWLEFSISPVISDDGIVGVCITGNDITEKKLIELEREFDQQNLESLINNTSDMMWSLDKKFKLITFNQPFADYIKKLTGQTISKGNPLSFKAQKKNKLLRYKQLYERAFAGETFTEVDYNEFPAPSWAEISFYPMYKNAEVIGTACFARNITERKLQEGQLQKNANEKELLIKELTENNKNLQQFSYITSHNMRGPIANLLGLSNLLSSYDVSDPVLKKVLEGIKISTQRFDETIKDLTTILSVKDSQSIPKEKLDFRTNFDNIKKQCVNLIKMSKAKISSDFSKAPSVYFNKAYLESVLLNLLTNALKYRDFSRPLKIHISTEMDKEMIIFKFSDNGIGFDAHLYEDKLFKLYQRFHDEREGKGLGLFLIKSQLEAFGASIKLESQVNRGTKIIIQFKNS